MGSYVLVDDSIFFVIRQWDLIIVRIVVKFLRKLFRWTILDYQSMIDHRIFLLFSSCFLKYALAFSSSHSSRRAKLLDAFTRLDDLIGVRDRLLAAFHVQ